MAAAATKPKPAGPAGKKPPGAKPGGHTILGVDWRIAAIGVVLAVALGLWARKSLAGSGTGGQGVAQPTDDVGAGVGADGQTQADVAALGDSVAAIGDQLEGIQEAIFGLGDAAGDQAAQLGELGGKTDQLGQSVGGLYDQVGGLSMSIADLQAAGAAGLDQGVSIVDGRGAIAAATAPTANTGTTPATVAAVDTTGAAAVAPDGWANYPILSFPDAPDTAPGTGTINLTPDQKAATAAGNFPLIDFPSQVIPTPAQGQAGVVSQAAIAAGQKAVNAKPGKVANDSKKGNLI